MELAVNELRNRRWSTNRAYHDVELTTSERQDVDCARGSFEALSERCASLAYGDAGGDVVGDSPHIAKSGGIETIEMVT